MHVALWERTDEGLVIEKLQNRAYGNESDVESAVLGSFRRTKLNGIRPVTATARLIM